MIINCGALNGLTLGRLMRPSSVGWDEQRVALWGESTGRTETPIRSTSYLTEDDCSEIVGSGAPAPNATTSSRSRSMPPCA